MSKWGRQKQDVKFGEKNSSRRFTVNEKPPDRYQKKITRIPSGQDPTNLSLQITKGPSEFSASRK